MDPREDFLVDAAKEIDDCPPWLQYCDAACCRSFTFRLREDSWVDRSDGEVLIHLHLDEDERRYYELHGARVGDTVVAVPEAACLFTNDRLHVSMTCTALREDRLCSLHPDGKPEICKAYTLEAVRCSSYWTHPRCLYRYKLESEQSP